MIEVYKIISNIYDKNVSENILTFRPNADFNLRGKDYTLEQKRIYKPECKHKVVTIWNTPPNNVVLSEFLNALD